MSKLYLHQAQAFDAWAEGKDVVVTSGTNSGKTLCYGLPALQTCLSEPVARCLFMFPTKALAQDQLQRLRLLSPAEGLQIETYDGDTPKSHRASIRKTVNVLISNPDMMHVGILPSHEAWGKFFRSLRLIALDEIHVYRGVFGSHVAGVLRRLLRLCEWYGSRPQIIACSATIGNPSGLFKELTGRKPYLVDSDGSPSGKRTFVFWNPPDVGDGRRLSANIVTSQILSNLAGLGQRTLAFSRSRISAELVLRYARRYEDRDGPKSRIESYRAGYTAKERREIEASIHSGDLLGISATNAMELGVDVGSLDAVVMNGYPGTASSFWQQAGRAGRGSRDGLAIMVAHEDPLEQFLVRKPDLLLEARNETVSINPKNPRILSRHLLCAAQERPISPTELAAFGPTAFELAESMDRAGDLQFQSGLFYYPRPGSPAADVNIRGSSGDTVRLLAEGVEIGQMEHWRALNQAHAGAVYLHRGVTYLVKELDLEQHEARMESAKVDYYTQAVVQSVLQPSPAFRTAALPQVEVSVSAVNVTDLVVEFRRRSLDGDTVLGAEPLDLPPETYDTVGVRFDLPSLSEEDYLGQLGGIHGIEHSLLAVAPLLAGCDRGDLGSAWFPLFTDTFRPAVFVFDRIPGGVGLSEALFDSLGGWIRAALQLLETCPCEDGCPSCLMSPRCDSMNDNLSKKWTVRYLNGLI